MQGGGGGQRLEVVAALQGGDHAAAADGAGDGEELVGNPAEIGGFELELRQRVGAVGVEAGADDDQLGAEGQQGGDALVFPGGAEGGAAGAGGPGAG